ncbi:MAG: heavy metal-binding domain-containing protein, partial [Planctomycetota bacterium]
MKALGKKTSKIYSRLGIKLAMLPVLALVLVIGFFLGRLGGSSEPASPERCPQAKTQAEPQMWTCSMHPTVRLPKKGLCPICNMEPIPAATGGDETMTSMRQLTVSE